MYITFFYIVEIKIMYNLNRDLLVNTYGNNIRRDR
jgi:hypothetical protein